MRASKSGWSTGGGDILTIKDDAGIYRQLVTEYGLLTILNFETQFAINKTAAGRKLQNSAQLCECLMASLSTGTAEIAMAESHMWT